MEWDLFILHICIYIPNSFERRHARYWRSTERRRKVAKPNGGAPDLGQGFPNFLNFLPRKSAIFFPGAFFGALYFHFSPHILSAACLLGPVQLSWAEHNASSISGPLESASLVGHCLNGSPPLISAEKWATAAADPFTHGSSFVYRLFTEFDWNYKRIFVDVVLCLLYM